MCEMARMHSQPLSEQDEQSNTKWQHSQGAAVGRNSHPDGYLHTRKSVDWQPCCFAHRVWGRLRRGQAAPLGDSRASLQLPALRADGPAEYSQGRARPPFGRAILLCHPHARRRRQVPGVLGSEAAGLLPDLGWKVWRWFLGLSWYVGWLSSPLL